MKINILFLLIGISLTYPAFGQISHGGKPYSMYQDSMRRPNRLKSADTLNTGIFLISDLNRDIEKENINKLFGDCSNCRNKIYGKEIDVKLDFFKKAQLVNIIDGNEIWLLNFQTSQAEGYQFLFNSFYLPEGSQLFFYNEDKSMLLGSFNSDNNREDKEFVTQYITGKSIFMELQIPSNLRNRVKLNMDKVVYIFEDFIRKGPYSKNGSESCNINTVCQQGMGWETEIKSVAMICEKTVSDYWGVCSGTLINKENNYIDSDKPYFLSANHCYELGNGSFADVKNWVFIFRHEASFCGSDGSELPGNLSKSSVGADIVSRDTGSNKTDYLLLKLKNSVGEISAFDVAFAGWNGTASGSSSLESVGIHHPNGDVKKIAISNNAPSLSDYNDGTGTKDHYRVVWDEGITAEGSSGSPLFNSSHQLIGELHGGTSFCKLTYDKDGKIIGGPGYPDWYGRFDLSWSNGNLSQYLTPTTKLSAIDGYTPPPYFNLNISLGTSPDKVYLGDNFKIAATSLNGESTITWYVWVNKSPGDFNNYQYGSSNCINEQKTTSNRKFESTNYINLSKEGTYKVTLFAFDINGRQTSMVSSIVVADKKDPCIFTHLYQTDCAKQFEFAMGSNIRLYDYVYWTNTLSSSTDACHELKFIGSNYILPKYQGISKLKWFYDGTLVKEFNFNTTYENQYDPGYPANPAYYYQTNYSQCFPLSTSGEHTIRLEAYGGRMSTDGYQFKHPFTFYNSYSSISKKIKVIDCDKSISITTKSQLSSYNGNVTGGNIKLTPSSGNIDVNSGESNKIVGYRSIKLTSSGGYGIHLKAGTSFSAKWEKCPENNCGCNNTKSALIEPEPKEKEKDLTEINSGIKIYPNPTTGTLFLDLTSSYELVDYFEILNFTGTIIYRQDFISDVNEIDLKNNPQGIYLLKVVQKNKEVKYAKIVLNN